MSTLDLRQLIRELNRIDLPRASFDYLVQRFRSALKDTSIPLTYSTSESYFRARIVTNEKIEEAAQLGAPPPSAVRGYQRCNAPGVSTFYAASRRLTALLEVNAQSGDIVYLSQWIAKEPAAINHVFSYDDFALRPDVTPREELLYSYLDTLFTRPIHATFAEAYKLTAAATTALTTNFSPNPALGIYEDGTVGIKYSSIAHTHKAWNTAFPAVFAREHLQLMHVAKIQILSREDEHFEVRILGTALEAPQEMIMWADGAELLPLPRTESNYMTLQSNGRSWVLPVYQSSPTSDEIAAYLCE